MPALADDPAKVNADPEGAAWFFKLKIADKSEFDALMTREQYDEFVKEALSHALSAADPR